MFGPSFVYVKFFFLNAFAYLFRPTQALAQGTTCSIPISPDDATLGLQMVTDLSCVSEGYGCVTSVCRACKLVDNLATAKFVSCGAVSVTAPTPIPTTAPPTPTPTTAAPTPTPATATPTSTPATSTTTTSVVANSCSATVSAGDASAGIWAEPYDCAYGGLGCFSSTCRFCKTRETATSKVYAACTTSTAALTSAPSPIAPISVSTTTLPTTAPISAPTNKPSTIVSATAAPAIAVIANSCSASVSTGDINAGIWAEPYACASGGLGCFSSSCRFCNYKETAASKVYAACSSSVVATAPVPTTPSPITTVQITTPPTSASTSAPTTDTPMKPAANTCSPSVSSGDANAGIWGEPFNCVNGGLGCFSSICRYCKWKTTAASGHLSTCTGSSTVFMEMAS